MPDSSSATSSDSDRDSDSESLAFYPAYCYPASPTWSVWVKLTCHDIHHALRPRLGFPETVVSTATGTFNPPSLLLFYLNHPIQFVQVIGVVVAYEDFHPLFYLFTLDDSSGATVDVTYRKPRPKPANANPHNGNNNNTTSSKTEEEDPDATSPHLLATLSSLTIGTTLLAKGTLTTFRGTRQLSLERLTPLPTPSTTREIGHIAARTTFLLSVLSQPWIVPQATRQRLLRDAQGEVESESKRARRARERNAHRLKREKRHAEEIATAWEGEEVERRSAAEEARRDGEAVMMMMRQAKRRRALLESDRNENEDERGTGSKSD